MSDCHILHSSRMIEILSSATAYTRSTKPLWTESPGYATQWLCLLIPESLSPYLYLMDFCGVQGIHPPYHVSHSLNKGYSLSTV